MNKNNTTIEILIDFSLKLEKQKLNLQQEIMFLNEQLKSIEEENITLRKTIEMYINKSNENA